MPKGVHRFRFEGVEYVFDETEITGRLERELWQAIGLTPRQSMEALSAGASFGLAAVVWLSRRQAGENVKYLDVETYLDGLDKSEVDLEFLPDLEVEGDPQLSGVSSDG